MALANIHPTYKYEAYYTLLFIGKRQFLVMRGQYVPFTKKKSFPVFIGTKALLLLSLDPVQSASFWVQSASLENRRPFINLWA